MGTRGFVGFVADGHETITYNQFDSYPSGLGAECLEFARTVNTWDVEDPWAVVKGQAAKLVHVDGDTKPTEEEVFALAQFANLNVSTKSVDDWYCLLRETHGNPGLILSSGYAEHVPDWPLDSLFCEWGYLFDLDAGVLEVYEGFQQTPIVRGRFANRQHPGNAIKNNGYHPVSLVASFSLTDLPTLGAFNALENGDEEGPLGIGS